MGSYRRTIVLALLAAATLLLTAPAGALAADPPISPPICDQAAFNQGLPGFTNCVNEQASWPDAMLIPPFFNTGAATWVELPVTVDAGGIAHATYVAGVTDVGRMRLYAPGGPMVKSAWWFPYDGMTNCSDSDTNSDGGFTHTVTYTRIGGDLTWPCGNNPAVKIDISLPVTALTVDRYLIAWINFGAYNAPPNEQGRDLVLKLPRQDAKLGGKVQTQDRKPIAGLTMTLSGTSNLEGPITRTTTTAADGSYNFGVLAGSYTVTAEGEPAGENGGSMSADTPNWGTCEGTATENRCAFGAVAIGDKRTADFRYTACTAPGRRANGKPITHCPIILLPGFLGSKISCTVGGKTFELWPNIPSKPRWGLMALQPDGRTNAQNNGPCTAGAFVPPGKDGVVSTVGGVLSIYKSTMDFLDEAVGPSNWWALPYDWRKSPEEAVPALDQLIEEVRFTTKASRVVLYAHSMGGLVMRDYISTPAHQDKVLRIATAGTPYWGAPKSHFSFLEGDTDTPDGSPLDLLTNAGDLQGITQNMQGLFFLHPSARLGPWLSLATGTGPMVTQDQAGERRWIQALGGNPLLLGKAHRWHDEHDGFPATDIDYEVFVGAGSPTATKVAVRRISGVADTADVTFGSGDGTVPIESATQGHSSGTIPAAKVGVHYVCGVTHVPLPGSPAVTSRVKDFLVKGAPVEGFDDNCPYEGRVFKTYNVNLSAGNVIVDFPGTKARGRAATTKLTLGQAINRGLVQVYQLMGRTTFVTDDRTPVTLQLKGSNIAVQTQSISSRGNGPVKTFLAGSGVVRLSSGGTVTSNGTKVRPARAVAGKPVTRAVVTRKGTRLLVRLVASSRNGVGVTRYRIGVGAVRRYRKPFVVTPAQFAKLLVSSTDRFGTVEKPHRLRR